jgi:CRP/FNR family transcriptional regulator, cyclic AMP receptor protein
MNEITKGMHEHPFFKDFQANQVELLSKCASTTNFTAGNYIFHDGEPANHVYLLKTGSVAITLEMNGHEPLSIMTVGAGGVVGWSWLFAPYRWHFSARVAENTSAITLDAKCVLAKCKEDYQLGYKLMEYCATIMGERLQATRAQLLSASLR